uniref:SFRICE_023625 n=1 Tax=Spodoptera frugiperda TaxID=7108 RepID=A0A2H1VYB8_SPOFR
MIGGSQTHPQRRSVAHFWSKNSLTSVSQGDYHFKLTYIIIFIEIAWREGVSDSYRLNTTPLLLLLFELKSRYSRRVGHSSGGLLTLNVTSNTTLLYINLTHFEDDLIKVVVGESSWMQVVSLEKEVLFRHVQLIRSRARRLRSPTPGCGVVSHCYLPDTYLELTPILDIQNISKNNTVLWDKLAPTSQNRCNFYKQIQLSESTVDTIMKTP